jgi:DNA mismatch repair protein MutS2
MKIMHPEVPDPLRYISAAMLEFAALQTLVAGYSATAAGRAWTVRLAPSGERDWMTAEQQAVHQARQLLDAGMGFDFFGLSDPTVALERALIPESILDAAELMELARLAELLHRFQNWWRALPGERKSEMPELHRAAAPVVESHLHALIEAIVGKFEPDGTLADHASPELARIRRTMARQHAAIESSLREMVRRLGTDGPLQDSVITVRGDRFVLPVKAEWKRRVPGVLHGASSTGQTLFVEPLETIEQNNELQRLLEEEQAEVRRILARMTRAVAEHAPAMARGAAVLAGFDSLFGRARFAQVFQCTVPRFSPDARRFLLRGARHPLLEERLRTAGGQAQAVVPLDLELTVDAPQLVISGPNTGGKTVALKTVGLLSLMAQAGIPVPAEEAELPVLDGVYADIGDAQSIAQNLSTFSAHITRIREIAASAGPQSLVLLDELGSATDPEEGAALATAIAAHFLERRSWCLISTHHTAMKVYAVNTPGVQNAAAGFDEETFAPTYQIRMGVPGISAGIQIARRLGLDPAIIADATARMGSQVAQIGRFLDQLHADLLAVADERNQLRGREQELARERERLDRETRREEQTRVQQLEAKLASLTRSFEAQLRDLLRVVEDKSLQQKTAKLAERGMAKLRRELREQVNATVVAHTTGADAGDPNAEPHIVRDVATGDTVHLRSLGKTARIERQTDTDSFEVSIGALKMRIRRDDIARVVARAGQSPVERARSRGIRVALAKDDATVASELNVVGRTVDEAIDMLDKFLDDAFLHGVPKVRIVHGSGMGILRKALRSRLAHHPHAGAVSEPPQNLGGAGVTEVELRD